MLEIIITLFIRLESKSFMKVKNLTRKEQDLTLQILSLHIAHLQIVMMIDIIMIETIKDTMIEIIDLQVENLPEVLLLEILQQGNLLLVLQEERTIMMIFLM